MVWEGPSRVLGAVQGPKRMATVVCEESVVGSPRSVFHLFSSPGCL